MISLALASSSRARSRHGEDIDAQSLDCAPGTRRALEELCVVDLEAFGESDSEETRDA